MKRIIDVPGTGCTEFPPRIRECFGEPHETWNVHKVVSPEETAALPFPESVRLLTDKIANSVSKKLILRGHSLGARAIMHSIINDPSLLHNIDSMKFICPPAEMVSHGVFFSVSKKYLADSMRTRFPFLATKEFLESLKSDTNDINMKFLEILRRHQFHGRLEIYYNPDDRFLAKVDDDYSFNIRTLLAENTGLNIHVHTITYGHNYEGYKKPIE